MTTTTTTTTAATAGVAHRLIFEIAACRVGRQSVTAATVARGREVLTTGFQRDNVRATRKPHVVTERAPVFRDEQPASVGTGGCQAARRHDGEQSRGR
jgi:hypothetical protein